MTQPKEWEKLWDEFTTTNEIVPWNEADEKLVKSFITRLLNQEREEAQKETMKGLQKEWLYRRQLCTYEDMGAFDIIKIVDNLVGGINPKE